MDEAMKRRLDKTKQQDLMSQPTAMYSTTDATKKVASNDFPNIKSAGGFNDDARRSFKRGETS